MGLPLFLINELHVTWVKLIHSGRVAHSLLASGGPRQPYLGKAAFLVSKQGLRSSLPEKDMFFSSYLILQSKINKLAIASISVSV